MRRTPAFIQIVTKAIVEDLAKAGVRAEVHVELVPGTKLHRLTVISPQFSHMRFSERQGLIWRIVDRAITKDDQLLISMILTLTPADLAGETAA